MVFLLDFCGEFIEQAIKANLLKEEEGKIQAIVVMLEIGSNGFRPIDRGVF